MKKLFTGISIIALTLCAFNSSGQGTAYTMVHSGDTVNSTAIKYLTPISTIGSSGGTVFLFAYEKIADSINAVVTLESSINGTDYATHPGTDALTVLSVSTSKEWIVAPPYSTMYLPKYWRIKMAISKATGSGKVRGSFWR